MLAVSPEVTLGVQATSNNGGNVAAHVTKALAEPRLIDWLASPHRHFEIWGWAKQGPRGQPKRWKVVKRRIRAGKTCLIVEEVIEPGE